MNLQHFVYIVILPTLSISMLCAFVRLVYGPSLPDRVVALDLMAAIVIGILAAYAVATGEIVYIDVAITLALIAFLGTVAFAYYLQKEEK